MYFSHFITHFARENCDYRTIKRLVCRKCFRKIALKIAAMVYVSFYDQCDQIRTLIPKPNFLIGAISWHFFFSFFSLSLSLFLRLVHGRGRARIRKEFGNDGYIEKRKKKMDEYELQKYRRRTKWQWFVGRSVQRSAHPFKLFVESKTRSRGESRCHEAPREIGRAACEGHFVTRLPRRLA